MTYLTEQEAATYIGVEVSILAELRDRDEGPLFRKKGKSFYFTRNNLDRYLAALPRWKSETERLPQPTALIGTSMTKGACFTSVSLSTLCNVYLVMVIALVRSNSAGRD